MIVVCCEGLLCLIIWDKAVIIIGYSKRALSMIPQHKTSSYTQKDRLDIANQLIKNS